VVGVIEIGWWVTHCDGNMELQNEQLCCKTGTSTSVPSVFINLKLLFMYLFICGLFNDHVG
jgi:hypothetical protein